MGSIIAAVAGALFNALISPVVAYFQQRAARAAAMKEQRLADDDARIKAEQEANAARDGSLAHSERDPSGLRNDDGFRRD